MRTALLPLALTLLPLTMQAQAHPGCPLHPQSLAAMHDCYRPLLVFSPSATDPRLTAQQATLDAAADDMMDRNLLLLPVLNDAAHYKAPLDAPTASLHRGEAAALRTRFHVAPGSFLVVLLGEDGGSKLRSQHPVTIEQLNSLIDTMPTRQREMQQPHSN